MEHPIRKSPLFGINHHESENLNSETPMIIREMMIYNRHLIEENIMLRSEIKQLETKNFNLNLALTTESNTDNTSDESWELPMEESKLEPSVIIPQKKVKMQKKGTQLSIDPAIGKMFSRQLKESGFNLSDVCRAMMLIALDRPRYRNMILDRIKQSERVKNTDREIVSFAFQYPVDLGENFTALLRSHKIKQYEFFEQMFKEFIQSYTFRKLLPDYINQIKNK